MLNLPIQRGLRNRHIENRLMPIIYIYIYMRNQCENFDYRAFSTFKKNDQTIRTSYRVGTDVIEMLYVKSGTLES